MPIPSPKEGGKSKRKFTWKSWHRKRWKARANTKRKKAHAAALPLLKESLAVCSLRQSYSWECQSHPPFNSLLLSTPPLPKKRKNPPKSKTRQFPPKQKHTLLTETKSVTDSKPSLPLFFFFLLLLLRLGHHLHGFNNSRAEVPSKTPATRKANYGRTKYQNLFDSRRGEEGSKNNIKFKT